MARVTVEDCLEKMPRSCRFELIRLATDRARDLEGGATTRLEQSSVWEKPTVVALREAAEGGLEALSVHRPEGDDLQE